jgi:hypothetical protein
VWHDHREVQPTESDHGNEDENRIEGMIADIGREYDIGSGEQHPPPEVHNFYRLLAALDKKVHNDTDVTIL